MVSGCTRPRVCFNKSPGRATPTGGAVYVRYKWSTFASGQVASDEFVTKHIILYKYMCVSFICVRVQTIYMYFNHRLRIVYSIAVHLLSLSTVKSQLASRHRDALDCVVHPVCCAPSRTKISYTRCHRVCGCVGASNRRSIVRTALQGSFAPLAYESLVLYIYT